MATRSTSTKSAPAQELKKSAPPKKSEVAVETTTESASERKPDPTPSIKAKEFKANDVVVVRNGFHGKLVYRSRKTGELFEWDDFGDEQEMEIGELKSARGNCKEFFSNNWFMFDDPAVIDYLNLGRYYKYAVRVEDFDNLFKKPADEVESIVSGMSAGQKRSVAYRARQMIKDGTIDSMRVINALEKSLGVELIER